MTCPHRNLDPTILLLHPDQTGSDYGAVLSVRCTDCSMHMEFVGIPAGSLEWRIGVNMNRQEVWLALRPANRGEIN
jgi:hypothetical protein